jgi:dipeptidyl aminopeptidase/acylaminoacyl peptidase
MNQNIQNRWQPLLTQTRIFHAAVSHGGVADWLKYYERRRPLGDETIPGFLGGKRPEDVVELYRRISPVYHVNNITTPLLLVVGEKDSRYTNAIAFYEALQQAGRPVTLVQYAGEGHEIMSDAVAEQHVRKAIQFFRKYEKRTRSKLRR